MSCKHPVLTIEIYTFRSTIHLGSNVYCDLCKSVRRLSQTVKKLVLSAIDGVGVLLPKKKVCREKAV